MSADTADRSVEAPGLHAAAVYDSEASLRARATPFLRAGLDRGEAVQAMVPADVEEVLPSGHPSRDPTCLSTAPTPRQTTTTRRPPPRR